MSGKRTLSPATSFNKNMETSLKLPRKNLGSASIFTCSVRKRLWVSLFISLFLIWCLLIYGFDWFSSGFSSTTLVVDKKDSVQSFSHESIQNQEEKSVVVDDHHDHDHDNIVIKDSSSSSNTNAFDESESFWDDPETIDIEELEKDLEPIFQDVEEKDKAIELNEKEKAKDKYCLGRYIYIHDLPSRYNDDLVNNCKLLSKWSNMCMYLENMGLGFDLGNPQRMFQSKGWFNTNQFSLEVIFHNRMKQYDCLTLNSSKASSVFVPYYAGFDVSRYLWDNGNVSIRDYDSNHLANWLQETKEWEVMGGMDHFLVAGRITWDFRRGVDHNGHWGNKLMLLPEFKNTTILTIESSPWNRNDFAIPYPTYFHPSKDNDVYEWQNRLRKVRRRVLYCFAGAPRPNMTHSIRSEIMDQCKASRRRCQLMECKNDRNRCQKPSYVMRMFQNSIFCLQPPGDSFTRRSTFDSILAGCIPVFFTPASGYVQYLWHLPKDYTKYSVLIPEDGVKNNSISIDSRLSQIPKSKIASMREEVIKLIPNVIYADPRSHLERLQDAFDLTVKGVLQRVEKLRKEIKKGKISSFDFDEEKSWKYFTFGTVDHDHEWDHFFLRTEKDNYY